MLADAAVAGAGAPSSPCAVPSAVGFPFSLGAAAGEGAPASIKQVKHEKLDKAEYDLSMTVVICHMLQLGERGLLETTAQVPQQHYQAQAWRYGSKPSKADCNRVRVHTTRTRTRTRSLAHMLACGFEAPAFTHTWSLGLPASHAMQCEQAAPSHGPGHACAHQLQRRHLD